MWDYWFMSTTRCNIITTRCRLHGTSTTAFHIVSAVNFYIGLDEMDAGYSETRADIPLTSRFWTEVTLTQTLHSMGITQ